MKIAKIGTITDKPQSPKINTGTKLKLAAADFKDRFTGNLRQDIAEKAKKAAKSLKSTGETIKKDFRILENELKGLAGEIKKTDFEQAFKNEMKSAGTDLKNTAKAMKVIFVDEMKDSLKECSFKEAVTAGIFFGGLAATFPAIAAMGLGYPPAGFAIVAAGMAVPPIYNVAYKLNRYWQNLGTQPSVQNPS